MYDYIQGKIASLTPTVAVIDTGGIGWQMFISLNSYSQLKNCETVKLFTVLIIREDAHLLYGFTEEKERLLFNNLISVSGVGASYAIAMLSAMSVSELASAIMSGNVMKLKSVKGIGPKTAERIIVDLKDKLSKQNLEAGINEMLTGEISHVGADAVEALVVMGHNRIIAEKAVAKILSINRDISVENLIREAMRTI